MVQHIDSMLVEGVVSSKQGHHVEHGELVLVEESGSWERAREEMYSRGRGTWMKALESLEGGLMVKGEDFQFTGCETGSG